jgi:murein DD-endopeptidase MepM/ murein hydrolase activator NlpD
MTLLAAACTSQPPVQVVFKGGAATEQAVVPEPPPPPDEVAAAPASGEVIVAAGESVYAIARRYNLSIRGLIDTNGLKPPYILRVGQRLILPRELVHTVAGGDTLYSISRHFRIDISILARTNGLREPYSLTTGQRLRIPTAVARTEPKTVLPEVIKADPPPADGLPPVPPAKPTILTASAAPTASASGALPPPPPRSANTFLWPVEGDVIAGFGPKESGRHNDGINIVAPRGTAVRAAENGVVAYIGNELRGYGNLVLIRHADGWVSAYAHNEVVLVRRGDVVRRGDTIGRVGSTGDVSTPQTHFELRKGVETVDPMKYLAWN